MARVISEAAVRLVADRKGLANSIRSEFRAAIKDAVAGGALFDDLNRDSDRNARRVASTWRTTFRDVARGAGGVVSAFASVSASIARMLLVGTALAGIAAGITSVVTTAFALGQALAQAAGVLGLIPAGLAAIAAVNATLKIGLSGVSEGFKAIGEDAATFEEAIKDLAPAAQEFLRALREQKGAFDDLRLDVQQRLFAGLGDAIAPLADRYLPIARTLFGDIASSLNRAAHEAVNFATSTRTLSTVTELTHNVSTAVDTLADAFQPAIAGLLDLTTVGSSFLPGFAEGISAASTRFADFMRQARETGQLKAFFEDAIATVRQLGAIVGNVFGGISNIMDAAQSSGGGLLDTIEQLTEQFQTFTGSFEGQAAFAGFFASMQRVITALGPAFEQIIVVIGRDFLPILADIASVIGPVLQPLFAAFGQLLRTLRPLFEALAGVFARVLEAMQPFFEALAEAIDEVMPRLIPIFDDIGEGFAKIIEAMIPLIPLFVQLLEVLLPIIPPFLDMIARLMPKFIELIEALMPLFEAWATALIELLPIITDIAVFLADVFIPVIGILAEVIAGIYNVITTVFTAVWDFIKMIWGAIGDFFVSIWDGIKTAFTDGTSGVTRSVLDWLGGLVQSVWNGMKDFANSIWQGIKESLGFFDDLTGGALSAIGNWAKDMFNAGINVIKGLLNGLKSAASSIINFFRDMINDAIDQVTSLLGIFSPSRVFEDIGQNIGLGLIKGLDGIAPAVADAATSMAGVTMDGFSNPLAMGQGGVNGVAIPAGATVVNQTNVMQQGTDVKQFSDLVLRRAGGDFLSGATTLTVARNGVQAGINDQWVGVR